MFSFDVVTLFTKVPVSEALDAVAERLKGEQCQGAGMGSSLTPVVADHYMEALEERALS